MKKIGPTPVNVIRTPPIAGMHNLLTLKAMEFKANALTSPSLGIIEASKEIRHGSLIVQEIPIKKTNANKFQIVSCPDRTVTPKEAESIARYI